MADFGGEEHAAGEEFALDYIDGEMRVGYQYWGRIPGRTGFARVDGGVMEVEIRRPSESTWVTGAIVAELKAVDIAVGFVPDDQIEIVVGHPLTVQVIGNWPDGSVVKHQDAGVSTEMGGNGCWRMRGTGVTAGEGTSPRRAFDR